MSAGLGADRATSDADAPVSEVRRTRGRPRSAPKAPTNTSTRDEILEAAARLFATQGYEGTTTRQIAELVGIKQASLYYHFADKSSIALALLDGTVSPSITFSDWLRGVEASPQTMLFALARFDLDLILGDPWNMHVLFRIPDVAAREAASGRGELTALQARYLELSAACSAAFAPDDAGTTVPEADLALVFGLVEGIVAQRYWGDVSSRAGYAESVPRGCLRLLRVPDEAIAAAASEATALITRFHATAPVTHQ